MSTAAMKFRKQQAHRSLPSDGRLFPKLETMLIASTATGVVHGLDSEAVHE